MGTRRIIASCLATVMMGNSSMSDALAVGNIPYKHQRAGEFCKDLDIGKKVITPKGTLICKSDGSRARWTSH